MWERRAFNKEPPYLQPLRGTAMGDSHPHENLKAWAVAQGKNNIGSFYAPLHLGWSKHWTDDWLLLQWFQDGFLSLWLVPAEVHRGGMSLAPVAKSAVRNDLESTVAAVARKILIDVGFCRTLQRPCLEWAMRFDGRSFYGYYNLEWIPSYIIDCNKQYIRWYTTIYNI